MIGLFSLEKGRTKTGYHPQRKINDAYHARSSDIKKLKDKLTYTALCPADEFMDQVSLLTVEKFQVYSHNLIVVGGDRATWIK